MMLAMGDAVSTTKDSSGNISESEEGSAADGAANTENDWKKDLTAYVPRRDF
jgi:hypothetical protein